jgi:hypothetical protein
VGVTWVPHLVQKRLPIPTVAPQRAHVGIPFNQFQPFDKALHALHDKFFVTERTLSPEKIGRRLVICYWLVYENCRHREVLIEIKYWRVLDNNPCIVVDAGHGTRMEPRFVGTVAIS